MFFGIISEMLYECRGLVSGVSEQERGAFVSIASICELAGNVNPEHFMRLFKNAYGMTPGQYRELNK